jgi:hypothetical protein
MAELRLRDDQKGVVVKIIDALRRSGYAALQAPTGWGKTLTALEVIKELGVRALWLVPRLSIGLHVFNHALKLGLRTLATAGRERLCSRNYSMLDFVRGVCNRCSLNRLIDLKEINSLNASDVSLDFGKIKEISEALGVCPYRLQGFLERFHDYDVIIAHYNRGTKLIKSAKPRLIVIDEAHNTLLPVLHKIETRVLVLILQKLGFEEEINQLIHSPETLKVILSELLDALVSIEDDELQPYIEELVSMIGGQIWYYDSNEDAISSLELPEIPRNAQVLFMSATLPPQLTQNAIIVKRGWTIPIKIDAKYTLSRENVERRKDEISKYIAEKYLTSGTVIFTTVSRELLLSNEVTWEDELIEKGRTPCDVKTGVLALKTFGRYAEGIDLDCFSRLVVLGLPLLPPDVMLRLRSKGINERDFIIIKTIQIIGRAFRSSEPPPRMPEVYLVDKRFLQINDELQKYEIQAIND